jgi:hypothetical protein
MTTTATEGSTPLQKEKSIDWKVFSRGIALKPHGREAIRGKIQVRIGELAKEGGDIATDDKMAQLILSLVGLPLWDSRWTSYGDCSATTGH